MNMNAATDTTTFAPGDTVCSSPTSSDLMCMGEKWIATVVSVAADPDGRIVYKTVGRWHDTTTGAAISSRAYRALGAASLIAHTD